MTPVQATHIYEVWAFHILLADTDLAQAGIVLAHEDDNVADDFFQRCIYYTSQNPSPRQHKSSPSKQCPLGGSMIYKGKIFGADIQSFKEICEKVEPRAMRLGLVLNNAFEWIELWQDQMNRMDTAHMLFDRPVPDYSWPSLNIPNGYNIPKILDQSDNIISRSHRSYPPSFTDRSYRPQDWTAPERQLPTHRSHREHIPHQKRSRHQVQWEHRPRQTRDKNDSDDETIYDYNTDTDSDEEGYVSPRSDRRHHRHEREYPEEQDKPEKKRYKYASLIAETVTANALGDIFGLLFESALGSVL